MSLKSGNPRPMLATVLFIGGVGRPANTLRQKREKRAYGAKSGKKAGRGWHHHTRALRRRSMGQGG
jgi:hypothetical protein